MTPVFQTRFGVCGNCMQAAAASFLDLPLESVPDFGARADSFKLMHAFFRQYGYDTVEREIGFVPRGYYFEIGVSTQLHEHIVVCNMGRLVHDPNPHGRGLIMRHFVLWPKLG